MDVSTIKDRYDKAVATVRGEVQDYWMNTAFVLGHQWTWYNQGTRSLEAWRSDDSDRVQATMNRLWPASRTIISKMLERSLAFEVLPTAPDDATMRGAASSEAILHDTAHRHGWESIRTKNAWATWKGGTAAICVDWDPKAAGRVDNGDGVSPVYKGDTVETPLSLVEFVVEPGAKNPERARWWVKSQSLPPAEVQATYGLEELPDADATYGMSPLQTSIIAFEVNSQDQKPELTRVLTYYERPNGLNKEGCVTVIVGDKVVHDGKWPFPFKDKLNLAVTYETELENRWTGETVMTMARPVQVLYNLAISSISEHMKNAGNARLAVPQSSIDLMDSFSDLPGEMFPYPDGLAVPSWVSPPQMPQWWSEYPNLLASEMDNLLGVHNVSRGEAPVNIESGYGLSILAEHDATPIGRMVRSQAQAWGKVATIVLELLASQVTESRTSMIRSPGEVPETVKWSGKDLEGQTEATVPEDAIMPRSRAGMQAMADKLVQMSLVSDLETYSALVEIPGQKAMLDRARPDVAKARRENSMMALGRPQIPADFDEHEIHIAEHNVFRKSARYERMTGEERFLVDEHIQAHATMAAELAGRTAQDVAVAPQLGATPSPDSRPTLTPDQLPPEVFAPPPVEAPPVDELELLAELSAQVGQ